MLTEYIGFLSGCPFFYFLAIVLGLCLMGPLLWRLLIRYNILVAVGIPKSMFLLSDNLLVEVLTGVHIE